MDNCIKTGWKAFFFGIILIFSGNLAAQNSTQDTTDSSWRTINQYFYFHGIYTYGSSPSRITADVNGNLYAIGLGYEMNNNTILHWVVRKSLDKGVSWSEIDDYAPPNNSLPYSPGLGILVDQKGNIFETGRVYDSSRSSFSGIVRKSSDQGKTWKIVDTIPDSFAGFAITMDSSTGAIYVAGNSHNCWVIQSSTDQGETWTTLDNFVEAGVGYNAIVIDKNHRIYAAGSSGTKCIVRTSADGNRWQTIDEFPGDNVNDMTVDRNGNVYIIGSVYQTSSSHWIVRKGSFTLTFTTIDDFQLTSRKNSAASGIVVDNTGTIYVVGEGEVQNATFHWLVRKSSDGGNSWMISDDYFQNELAHGIAITIDPDGNLYTAGTSVDHSTPLINWTTRVYLNTNNLQKNPAP